MARVLLHDNQLCERGTTNALVDYARALRSHGHETVVSYWQHSPANVPSVISRLEQEFTLLPHDTQYSLGDITDEYDAAYFIKAGDNDGLVLPGTPSFVHAVFQNYEPHGSRYAYVSSWLARQMRDQASGRRGRRNGLHERGQRALEDGCANSLEFEHLDHIVDMPSPQSGTRQALGIPEDAFVILRYGGYDTFDIDWAMESVRQLLDQYPNWHFVGVNTKPFTNHSRSHFLPAILDPVEKASLVLASDVFLSARSQGESFGLAIAEALQIGTPVLAWQGGADRNHLEMLRGLDATYRSARDMATRLKRLANSQASSSTQERRARGNMFRPKRVAPELMRQLQISGNGPEVPG